MAVTVAIEIILTINLLIAYETVLLKNYIPKYDLGTALI